MARRGDSDGDPLEVALRHPLRQRLLKVAAEWDRVSPSELADQLDEPLSNVIYHVRVLVGCGGLVFLEEVPSGGSIKHYYKFDVTEPWALAILGLPESES